MLACRLILRFDLNKTMPDTANSQEGFVPGNWCIQNLPEAEKMHENLNSITKQELAETIGKEYWKAKV
jgi:hypothetical protein